MWVGQTVFTKCLWNPKIKDRDVIFNLLNCKISNHSKRLNDFLLFLCVLKVLYCISRGKLGKKTVWQ